MKKEKSVAIKPARTTWLCTGLESKATKQSVSGRRGSNLPRVTRGKRRSEGIPWTALLQVNPGWALLQRGCPRYRRGRREVVAAKQPTHLRRARAGSAFPWLTLTPAGATRHRTHRTLWGGQCLPGSPRPSACARKWVSLFPPARQAEQGKRRASFAPGLGQRSSGRESYESLGLWSCFGPRRGNSSKEIADLSPNFHRGRTLT